MNTHWIQSKYHISAFGETGAGKTVLANQIFGSEGNDRIGICLNVQEKGYIRGKEIRVSSPDQLIQELANGIQEGVENFNVIPYTDTGTDELAAISDFVFPMAKSGVRFLIVADEAHEIARSGEKGTPLHRLHKKGRDPGEGDGGIKMVTLTQSPASLDNDVLRQSKYHVWVGEPNKMEKEYLNTFDFPTETVMDLNTKDQCMFEESGGEEISHCFTVVKNGEVYTGPHLANPKFAE